MLKDRLKRLLGLHLIENQAEIEKLLKERLSELEMAEKKKAPSKKKAPAKKVAPAKKKAPVKKSVKSK